MKPSHENEPDISGGVASLRAAARDVVAGAAVQPGRHAAAQIKTESRRQTKKNNGRDTPFARALCTPQGVRAGRRAAACGRANNKGVSSIHTEHCPQRTTKSPVSLRGARGQALARAGDRPAYNTEGQNEQDMKNDAKERQTERGTHQEAPADELRIREVKIDP